MEQNLTRRVVGLKDKMPDIQKTLDMVQYLKLQKDEVDPIETTFELNDTLYAKAEVPPTEEVYLWLGVRRPHHCTRRTTADKEAGERHVGIPNRRG
jgi:hypothetical protein